MKRPTNQTLAIDRKIVRAVRTNPVLAAIAVDAFARLLAGQVVNLVRDNAPSVRVMPSFKEMIERERGYVREARKMARALRSVADRIGE